MRTIKFRAWDKDLKRWAFSTEVTLEGSGQYIHHHYPKTGHQPGSVNEHKQMGGCPHIEAICLYTGLTDKNGKEIYEGDIVIDDERDLYTIEYEGYSFSENPLDHVEYVEVVGNIYENPELLVKPKL